MIENDKKKGEIILTTNNVTKEDILRVADIYTDTLDSLDKVLIGQKNVKKAVAAAILSDNNSKILLLGNTGVGKTSLINYLANDFSSSRISITSDMIPIDIQEQLKGKRDLEFLHIDEFNRASGKVQSVFIELFAEKQMSMGNEKISFKDFYVFASQNIADIAGIFNVPQAIYDRFDISVLFEKLTEEEKRILLFRDFSPLGEKSLAREDILFIKEVLANFKINENDENLMMRVFNIIDNMKKDNHNLFAGSNIRAHRYAVKLAKLNALTEGRNYILASDIAGFIKYLYLHRIDQNVAKMTDYDIQQNFDATEQNILKLRREKN